MAWITVKTLDDPPEYTAVDDSSGQVLRTLSGQVWFTQDLDDPFLIRNLEEDSDGG